MTSFSWSKQTYQSSVSRRCFGYTPYDNWDYPDVPSDDELKAIVEMESQIGVVPDWAIEIVELDLEKVAPCGHYRFPLSYLETIDAIGARRGREFRHTCFTVDPERRDLLAAICLCLDGWIDGASAEVIANELLAREISVNWQSVCADLWAVLGDHTELKHLLVERTLLQTRWWLKSTAWDSDSASPSGPDQYLGALGESLLVQNGNPKFSGQGFDLASSDRLVKISKRLRETCHDWQWFDDVIGSWSWPCAPKTFRYLENLLWSIGQERPAIALPSYPLEAPDTVPDFLQMKHTCVDATAAGLWWQEFLSALDTWLRQDQASSELSKDIFQRLGQRDETKIWLVRLYAHRLRKLALFGANIGRLVGKEGSNWGTGKIRIG